MIALHGVGLDRRTREEFSEDLKSRIFAVATGRFRRPPLKTVLDRIDLEIPSGQKVGLIGANGAGKSTLLKVVCGILRPQRGTVRVDGRVAPLLELGAGFDADSSVVENVLIYGVLLGVPRRTMEERVDAILAFSELDEYRKYPVRALSSGMAARLGFAIATEVDAEILLIDEALSVGDASFRAKSRERIDSLLHPDRTVIVVSHDLPLIRALTERVVWIDHGRIAADGEPHEVLERYLASVDAGAAEALARARAIS